MFALSIVRQFGVTINDTSARAVTRMRMPRGRGSSWVEVLRWRWRTADTSHRRVNYTHVMVANIQARDRARTTCSSLAGDGLRPARRRALYHPPSPPPPSFRSYRPASARAGYHEQTPQTQTYSVRNCGFPSRSRADENAVQPCSEPSRSLLPHDLTLTLPAVLHGSANAISSTLDDPLVRHRH